MDGKPLVMENEGTMIGKRVVFNRDRKGVIRDKVCVPLASGTNEYVPFDNYMIEDDEGALHVINPIDVHKTVKE